MNTRRHPPRGFGRLGRILGSESRPGLPRRRSGRALTAGLVTSLLAGVLGATPATSPPAHADTPAPATNAGGAAATPAPFPEVNAVPQNLRARALPGGWHDSADLAWTTTGDATGFHLLTAAEDEAYAWRTVATLREPDVETDRWVGNACVTGSGRRAVVVYAPRAFTNETDLSQRGAYTAVVDLTTGAVTKLGLRASLAYFSPGCGTGEEAVLTQERDEDAPASAPPSATRLFTVDTTAAELSTPVELTGQVTSAVPVAGGIVAAAGHRVVSVGRGGRLRTLATTSSVPFRLMPDAGGGVTFLDEDGRADTSPATATRAAATATGGTASTALRVRRLTGTGSGRRIVDLASGATGRLSLAAGTGGLVFLTGEPTHVSTLPTGIRRLRVPVTSELSTQGHLALLPRARTVGAGRDATVDTVTAEADSLEQLGDGDTATPVHLRGRVLATGTELDFRFAPGVRPSPRLAQGSRRHPLNPVRPDVAPAESAGTPATAARSQSRADRAARAAVPLQAVVPMRAAVESTDPVDGDASCAVPRNDLRSQVYQPTPRQVEWAADQAVVGHLTTQRAANYRNSGLPAYSPQGLFPPLTLEGGGRVPVQILLGIMAQESNLWQASNHALSGETGNPLVGNFYGRKIYDADAANDWDIDFTAADCGYGLTQITDGMRKAGREKSGEVALTLVQQRAAALDYTANIAAGLRILQDKWNQTRTAGIIHSDGDWRNPENWFFAVWAYNSGLHPDRGDGSPWGLGWSNNPANPRYPQDRLMFNMDARDAAHPQDWPYPEKIMGWAAFSITTVDGAGFRPAWWNTVTNRGQSKPAPGAFCDERNDCNYVAQVKPTAKDVDGVDVSSEPAGPCMHQDANGDYDLRCWWHWPTTFNDCAKGQCGHELLRFDTTYNEPLDGTHYPPTCTTTPERLVVDDVPVSEPSARSQCAGGVQRVGSFTLSFAAGDGDGYGEFPSRIDFHQVGAGYGGHFWFGHTQPETDAGLRRKVTGTWTLDREIHGWARVAVHIPQHHAQTQQARYVIALGDGRTRVRTAMQVPTLGESRDEQWLDLGVLEFDGVPSVSLDNITADGKGNDAIAWDSVAFTPLGQKPKQQIVALGDSYSSGEGVSPLDGSDYYPETDFDDDAGHSNLCHRSKYAWSRQGVLSDNPEEQIGARGDVVYPAEVEYHLLACSGAVAKNVIPRGTVLPDGAKAGRQGSEAGQIDQGYLDENTTLVTISIGGNDARFAGIVQKCVTTAGCQDQLLDSDTDPMKVAVPSQIRGMVRDRVAFTVRQIHQAAPNAAIVLMGYPRAFPEPEPLDPASEIFYGSAGVCSGDYVSLGVLNVAFGRNEGIFLNGVSDALDEMYAGLVEDLKKEDIRVAFSDPRDDFAGHDLCSVTPALHGIEFANAKTEAEKTLLFEQGAPVSQQSFHPNELGAQLYAQSLNATLRELGL